MYKFKPSCFPDYQTYRDWIGYAKLAGEVVTPCDDCSAKYKKEMQDLGLCQEEWVTKNLVICSRSKYLSQGVFE